MTTNESVRYVMMENLSNAEKIADLENLLSLDSEIQSCVMPRWARKSSADEYVQVQHQQQKQQRDRFIPQRTSMEWEKANHRLSKRPSERSTKVDDSGGGRRELALKAGLLSNGCIDCCESPGRIIHYKTKAPSAPPGYVNNLRVLYTANERHIGGGETKRKAKATRHIPSAPCRVLDAPELVDDYYLNLVAWGCNNRVAVALGSTVYVWDAASGSIVELTTLDTPDDYVCSVSWLPGEMGDGHLAIGTAEGSTEIWDVATTRALRRMDGHSARVSALAWNTHIVSSASRDSTVIHHDVRVRDHAVGSCIGGHSQEICGLAWSPDGSTLASGGNDNLVCLWNASTTGTRSQAPDRTLVDHCAAVKALAWCPHERNLLATGAGTADRSIKLWNAQLGTALNSIDTGSQVCALAWNPHEKELLSGHGYAEHQLTLWKYPTMTKLKDLKGHSGRVLSLQVSPDGNTVLSAGADETLRFWDCFGVPGQANNKHKNAKNKIQRLNNARPLSIR